MPILGIVTCWHDGNVLFFLTVSLVKLIYDTGNAFLALLESLKFFLSSGSLLLSAPLLGNFICSSLAASLLALTDIDCQTKEGMSIGLLDPLYLLVLKPSAL